MLRFLADLPLADEKLVGFEDLVDVDAFVVSEPTPQLLGALASDEHVVEFTVVPDESEQPFGCGYDGGIVAVDLTDGTPATALAARVGGAEVITPEDLRLGRRPLGPEAGLELEVFMHVDATDRQIADVRAELEASPLVVSFRFLTKADAYEEFERIFADQPALLADTSPDALPTSFRVRVTEESALPRIESAFRWTPGVDEVVVPRGPDTVASFVRARVAERLAPGAPPREC